MNQLLVSGGRPLHGRCLVQGSKNIALHLYAASLLIPDVVELSNAPDIIDTHVCAELLRSLGADADYADQTLRTKAAGKISSVIPAELGGRIRPTACFGAAVLVRAGRVAFPLPGGDAFCDRPIDRHLAVMASAGADITLHSGRVEATLPAGRPGAFSASLNTAFGPSLGATVTALFLAVTASGTSVLTDASIEPEVMHTIDFLNRAGADISVQPDGRIEIQGVDGLRGSDYMVPVDRLEAGTLVMATVATSGRTTLDGARLTDFPSAFHDAVDAVGIEMSDVPGGVAVARRHDLRAIDFATAPHPGFPTDLQPQMTALLTLADGLSTITEAVYPKRATHVAGLREFGADISENGKTLRVRGPRALTGTHATGVDIRCVTALLLAALTATGTSRISGIFHLNRGYSSLVPKLANLGANISFSDL
ncbi:UDP-N-acetylglucosamine 1-carboxyvinyltransferase [Nonomuraea sp. NPDC050227]|uniref:UDP-N-acetylglucosamine 1-carboxyvinyltransferase n=1 Tax=Nonomuraea sp. NPDC050227 TaxID=3364360 RepID=UPI0037B7788B